MAPEVASWDVVRAAMPRTGVSGLAVARDDFSEGLSELNRRIRSIFLEGLNGTYLNTEIQTST
jgi:hypothetical protein